MLHPYHHEAIRFATWVGPGRDPQVAYVDERQLVVASSELGTEGLVLHPSGSSLNTLGGARSGTIDDAVLHRIVHTVVDQMGAALFRLGTPCTAPRGPDGLCDTGRRTPLPGTEAAPRGSLVIMDPFVVQWVRWADPLRAGVLRRGVYADHRFLLEAGVGPDGTIRLWPARALEPLGLELLSPSARELGEIEARISSITAAWSAG